MKYTSLLLLLIIFICSSCASSEKIKNENIPGKFLGEFTDDYDIRYQISDSLFFQYPSNKYHIILWNTKAQYIIAKNDSLNASEKNLYTRIDYLELTGMAPYTWGFCYTIYDAPNISTAKKAAAADRGHPKTGCGGYPFSRLKRTKASK